MGCCGDREKGLTVKDEQKWDYITLSDFRSTSCLEPFSYIWLWILIFISVAVYAADAFTAITLLVFNKWTGQVKPVIDFKIAKWIFAITIIVSYVFLLYRWVRAVRVIRSGGVAESYLEPLAAIYQSMRVSKTGQGWRRFLVFAELTRSKKGVDYLALFVYFQFKGALIIIVAQGPRIVINALTLWAVMKASLLPTGEHAAPKDSSPAIQFFKNIEFLAQTGNKRETIIYFTMLFSLVVWVIAALSLLFSLVIYIFFLWHYIPNADGTLSKYCRRTIETRLERIVSKKVRKAIEKQELKRKKEEQRMIKKGETDGSLRAPTLPKLGDDDSPSPYSMSRSDTLSTLPQYSSPTLARTNTTSTTMSAGMNPSFGSLSQRPMPPRSDTNTSYSSNAPLLSEASSVGLASPVPPLPPLGRNAEHFGAPPRNQGMPQGLPGRPYSPASQERASPASRRDPLPTVNTSFLNGRVSPSPQLISPLPNDSRGPPPARGNPYPNRYPGPPTQSDSDFSPYDNRGTVGGPSYEMSPVDMTSDDDPLDYYANSNGADDYQPPQMPSALRPGSPAMQNTNRNFASSPPSRSGTAPPANTRPGLPASLQSAIQRREASNPLPNRGPNGFPPQQRSATAPLRQPGWAPGSAQRSNTMSPGAQAYGNGYTQGQPRGGEPGW